MSRQVENILGYEVTVISTEKCADSLFHSLREGKSTWLACFNPHSYAMTLQDETFSRALKTADVLIFILSIFLTISCCRFCFFLSFLRKNFANVAPQGFSDFPLEVNGRILTLNVVHVSGAGHLTCWGNISLTCKALHHMFSS